MNSLYFNLLIPEIFLSLSILFMLVYNAFIVTNKNLNYPLIDKEACLQVFFILFCTCLLFFNNIIEGFFFTHSFISSLGIVYLKIVLLVISSLILPSLYTLFKVQNLNFFEYYIFYLLSILASLLLVSASDMMIAYLVIEMQALSFYVLTCFNRNSVFSVEAGFKYFISGAFFSSLFLLGSSLIYGTLGTLNFNFLLQSTFFIYDKYLNILIIIGFVLVLITLLFKLSLIPFHFWSVDAYDGAPLSSTIVFSVIPKLPIFVILIKILLLLQTNYSYLIDYLILLAVISFIISCFLTFFQTRFKRFLIYSSIVQVSLLITSISVNSHISVETVSNSFFFLIIYLISSILMWSLYSMLYEFNLLKYCLIKKNYNTRFETSSFLTFFNLAYKLNKGWIFLLLIILFSFAGVPPFVGFLSKLFVLINLLLSLHYIITFFIIIINAISVYYYLRILKILIFETGISSSKNKITIYDFISSLNLYIVILLSFFLFLLFIMPSALQLICHKCAIAIIYF